MPLSTPDFETIRGALLRDLQNLRADADVGPDSDFYVRASSVASAVEGLYQHQSWIARQIFPDSADRDYLEQHARVRGLGRKPPVAAKGLLQLGGNPGAGFAAGLKVRLGEQLYTTQAGGQLDVDGQARVAVAADLPGLAGNVPAGTVAELMAAPSGLASRVSFASMDGGVDEEDDAALLARLLELIRRPPAGGNRHDYRRWALEVPGVSAAYVYPLRRGLGTVDVVITAQDSLPSADTLAAVQAHIEDLRPVTAKNCLVLAPTPRPVDIEVALTVDGTTVQAVTEPLRQVLAAHFSSLAPGSKLYKSRLEALISDLPGVVDRQLLSPADNIAPTVNEKTVEWLRLGKLTVRGMQ